MGDTLIRKSRLKSGVKHFDPELAVEVLQRLLLGSGGEHCNLELAVEVRRRKGEGRRKEEAG